MHSDQADKAERSLVVGPLEKKKPAGVCHWMIRSGLGPQRQGPHSPCGLTPFLTPRRDSWSFDGKKATCQECINQYQQWLSYSRQEEPVSGNV